MKRRHLMLAAASAPLAMSAAWAHHGWSGFDQERPIYLEGKVVKSMWQNPHVELVIEVASDMKVPPDLSRRALPAQSAPVDGPGLLAKAVKPTRTDRQWELELAPLTRMDAWKIPEIKPGTQISAVGFTTRDEKGEAVMRVEYLFVDGKVYGLRSSPA
ncbi:DUF6152 family protein [Variovorax sp. J22R133]|uniref:DUF6152 family protein n=1 Tax=Variovorax brevis TaxID=3053503 RepID=UPI0025761E08|nr:DUF6152 family protein [Variovorax sp. J22R133]MDM0112441.1 DUF6152 family protein [Variovorax sp. J22R133]